MKDKKKVGDQGRGYDGECHILSLNSQGEISLNIKGQPCKIRITASAVTILIKPYHYYGTSPLELTNNFSGGTSNNLQTFPRTTLNSLAGL